MEDSQIIYKDEYYTILQTPEYPYIPGFCTIIENNKEWYSSIESINRLALLEKIIRQELLNLGVQLVGIYREESPDKKLKVLIIPYHIKQLENLQISPDLYQPYISKYLNSFDTSYTDKVKETNSVMKRCLYKGRR